MNIRSVVWTTLAATLAASPAAIAGEIDGTEGIPLPAGQFSVVVQGPLTSCVNPGTGAAEACSKAGVLAVPFNTLEVGALTRDRQGNACSARAVVLSTVPTGTAPPYILVDNGVLKLLRYDPATGIGDASYTGYNGGKCHGTTFDSAGAAHTLSATLHFTVTDGGDKITSAFTSFTGAPGAYAFGGFSLLQTEVRQTRNER